MKYIIILICILLSAITVNAEKINNNISINNKLNLENTEIKKIKLGEELILNFENHKKELSKTNNSKIEFEWSLEGNTIEKGPIYKRIFKKIGNKELSLNIYSIGNKGKKLINNKIIQIFVYKDINLLIIDNINIEKNKLNIYIEKANNQGIYVKEILNSNEKKIKQEQILKNIIKNNINIKKGNYITIWGDKNFIFSTISKLNREIKINTYKNNLNLVLISPFNTDVLNNYIKNFVYKKDWIDSILLLPESSKDQILTNPSSIKRLENHLKSKEYEYININKNSKISSILFISTFINNLSNRGISNIYIYLIIILPFLFTGISVFKHLVGLSPIGVIIPILLTILMFQIGIIITALILGSIILINLLLGKITNKYTLLYTPKISFIIIINIIIIMGILNILFNYNLINIDISDTLFIILFLIISERLISIILSKEFGEYKYNLFNTILFSVISYLILSIAFIQTVILAYPEIILLLIPINFIIGKFTGLRITEYFRFKEVIKSIEEE